MLANSRVYTVGADDNVAMEGCVVVASGHDTQVVLFKVEHFLADMDVLLGNLDGDPQLLAVTAVQDTYLHGRLEKST